MQRGLCQTLLFAFALWFGFSASAETLRVTVWNVQSALTSKTNDEGLQSVAGTLQKIEPDVLLLQGVRDWQTCSRLAQALKPVNYGVLVCSSFKSATTNDAPNPQVAILARQKAYFSWADAWHGEVATPGGFAFAAIQIGQQRLGFFSALLAGANDAAAQQLLRQAATVKKWDANRVQTCIIGGALIDAQILTQTAPALRVLDQSGFPDVCLEDVSVETNRLLEPSEYLRAESSVFGLNPQAAIEPARPYPVTCELELDGSKAAALWNARTETLLARAAQAAARVANAPPQPSAPALPIPRTLWEKYPLAAPFIFGCVTGVMMLGWYLLGKRSRPRPSPPLLDGPVARKALPPSYTVVMPHSTSGSAEASPASAPGVPLEKLQSTQTQSAAWQRGSLPSEPVTPLDHELGLTAHLREWLKNKLLRRLISDRAALLQTQQVATLKVEAVHRRLSQIESKLQVQTHSYERRIEELTRELLAAKEENRELIRVRINQVKSEMEAARARLLAENQELKGP
jgi:hypothetical protein